MDEVRKSIARISFQWTKSKKEVQRVVLCGLIVSTGVIDGDTEESIIVLVDGTFFTPEMAEACKETLVHLPNARAGYDEHDGPWELIADGSYNYLCALKLNGVTQEIKDYITSVRFETSLVGQGEEVYSFLFPTEDYITPTAYCPGCTIDAHQELVIHGSHVHEYAHFGSPLLNPSGNVIGINSGSQGQTQAWSVEFLKSYFYDSKFRSLTSNISYLKNGMPHEG